MTVQNPAISTLPERPVLISFLIFILVIGGAAVATRVTYGELAPIWVAASRFGLAALAFWAMAIMRKSR